MSAKNQPVSNGPVALPPGSFDATKLNDAIESRAKAKPEDQEGHVIDAVMAADEAPEARFRSAPAPIPGFKFIDVHHAWMPEGQYERTQVPLGDGETFDPDAKIEVVEMKAYEPPAQDPAITVTPTPPAPPPPPPESGD